MGMVLVALIAPCVAALASAQRAGASAPPSLNVSPQGNYRDGQTISVAVGPNGYFTPHRGVNVIECADPGGLASNLPKDITTCDGNTIQGNTILVGSDGSFSQTGYTVYLLPSSSLGEQGNFKPVCNQTNYCVLYVGQDQNDFTAPKVFSAPFLIAPGSGTTTTTSTSTGSSGSSGSTGTPGAQTTSTTTGVGPSVSLATTRREHVSGSRQHRPTRRQTGGSCWWGSRCSSQERSADDASFGGGR